MPIHLATIDSELTACYPVMHELRPHLTEAEFIARVKRQQQHGYQLAYLTDADKVVAVAGFRLGENLAWGRFLYVDDLVTLTSHRSQGHGAQLLAWLKEQAQQAGCAQLHLDSGIQRTEAHRFYEREGMRHASLHFVTVFGTQPTAARIARPEVGEHPL